MNDSSDRAPGTLLYELESIQNLLSEDEEYLKNIPILHDVVSEGNKPVISSPTIEQPLAKNFAIESETTLEDDYYLQRELLIQEVVDEFIPTIEARLREKLHQLTDGELQAMLKP